MPNVKNPMINVVIIQGRLTRDPELRYTATGSAVCSFSVANEHRAKADDGYETKTCFFDCSAWGKQAEFVATLHKGDNVQVQGKLRQESWENQGQTRSKVVIQVDKVDSMAWPDDGARAQNPQVEAHNEPAQPQRQQQAQPCAEDDISF